MDAGQRFDPAARHQVWFDLTAATVANGLQMWRARVGSEPVADYIRFEYNVTAGLHVAAS